MFSKLPGLPNIQEDLEATPISVALTTSLFILFGGIGPIIWASMSDFYHIRRFLYLSSLLLFVGATIGCGLSPNVWVLVVLRCIQSVGTSVTMSVGAGTVADCWEITERGSAFSVLFVGQFLGPLVGPIIGGGIVSAMGWRATFWFCAGYGVFLFCFLLLFLPETYRIDHVWDNGLPIKKPRPLSPVPLPVATRDEEEGGSSGVASDEPDNSEDSDDEYIQEPPPQGRMNPIQSIALLRHTFVWLIALQTGFCFGTMFTIETIIPDLYDEYYHFESWQTGLSFLGAGIGNVLGAIVSGRLSDLFLRRARDRRGGLSVKEDRLTLNAWPGGFICVPMGVLIFGWCTSPNITVWAPIIGFSIVCFGMSQVYASGSAYLVDSIPGKGASVTACSNLVRLLMACILSLIAKPIVSSIGSGYLSVILASLNYIGMGFYALVKFKGASFRKASGYGDNPI
ncbi:major facilitator superfamily domain-containing protein [Phycomyces blakesleeanus]|uniref:Major facilitator superfamily domain-containing protein n=1 Tax=Phycomyces blakesleeanus TaxID=4837 RepID=A0ABR3B1B1_PHYBL